MAKLSPRQWACALFSALLLLGMLCTASIAVFVWYQLRPDLIRSTKTGRIAYVGGDGNIYTVDRDSQNKRALTTDAESITPSGGHLYRFPTWSLDNRWVAFVGVAATAGQRPTNTLYAAPAAGGDLNVLFSSQDSGPFYLYWSPDSRSVAFLSSETQGPLSLRLAGLDGQSQLLDVGQPYYLTWGPDSNTLITHVGGTSPGARIGRIDIKRNLTETLLDTPALFLAPAWSPTDNGILIAAELDENGPALYLTDELGRPQKELVRYQGLISFAWSPKGDRLAYIVTDQPQPSGLGQFAFGRVQVLGRAGNNARMVSSQNALAFFWAPDGEKIAYLTITKSRDPQLEGHLRSVGVPLQQGDLRLAWRVANLSTDTDQAVATFLPTSSFISLIPFFDQYAQSLTLWSPDSTALVYSARNDAGASEIWVASADGKTSPQRIADGDLAVWSWP